MDKALEYASEKHGGKPRIQSIILSPTHNILSEKKLLCGFMVPCNKGLMVDFWDHRESLELMLNFSIQFDKYLNHNFNLY